MRMQPSLPGMSELAPRPSSQPGYKKKTPEFDEQAELFKFLRLFTPAAPEFGLIHASLNGLFLPFAKLKEDAEKMGMTSGVWDVCVPIARYHEGTLFGAIHGSGVLYSVLYIEMKSAKGSLTDSQKDFQRITRLYSSVPSQVQPFRDDAPRLPVCRPAFVVCKSWLEAAQTIVDYLEIKNPAILKALQ